MPNIFQNLLINCESFQVVFFIDLFIIDFKIVHVIFDKPLNL